MNDGKIEINDDFRPFEETFCGECEKKFKFEELVKKIDPQDGSLTLECPHCGYEMGGSF